MYISIYTAYISSKPYSFFYWFSFWWGNTIDCHKKWSRKDRNLGVTLKMKMILLDFCFLSLAFTNFWDPYRDPQKLHKQKQMLKRTKHLSHILLPAFYLLNFNFKLYFNFMQELRWANWKEACVLNCTLNKTTTITKPVPLKCLPLISTDTKN